MHEQVHMVMLAVEFHKLGLEVTAKLSKDAQQVIEGGFGQHAAAYLVTKTKCT